MEIYDCFGELDKVTSREPYFHQPWPRRTSIVTLKTAPFQLFSSTAVFELLYNTFKIRIRDHLWSWIFTSHAIVPRSRLYLKVYIGVMLFPLLLKMLLYQDVTKICKTVILPGLKPACSSVRSFSMVKLMPFCITFIKILLNVCCFCFWSHMGSYIWMTIFCVSDLVLLKDVNFYLFLWILLFDFVLNRVG